MSGRGPIQVLGHPTAPSEVDRRGYSWSHTSEFIPWVELPWDRFAHSHPKSLGCTCSLGEPGSVDGFSHTCCMLYVACLYVRFIQCRTCGGHFMFVKELFRFSGLAHSGDSATSGLQDPFPHACAVPLFLQRRLAFFIIYCTPTLLLKLHRLWMFSAACSHPHCVQREHVCPFFFPVEEGFVFFYFIFKMIISKNDVYLFRNHGDNCACMLAVPLPTFCCIFFPEWRSSQSPL